MDMEEMNEFLFCLFARQNTIVVFTRLREARDAVSFTFSIIPNSIDDTLSKLQIWTMNTCVPTPRLIPVIWSVQCKLFIC